jgi:hypothetical protein
MTLNCRWTNFWEVQASHWAICFWEIIFCNFHSTNRTDHTEMKAECILQQSRDTTKFFSQIAHMSFWSCSVLTGDAFFSGPKRTAQIQNNFEFVWYSAIKRCRRENYFLSYNFVSCTAAGANLHLHELQLKFL